VLAIFRGLAEEHPETEQYAFELCEALLFDVRRDGRRDGRPGQRDANGRGQTGDELANLREARDCAQRLLQRRPEFTEYRRLRARVGLELARALLRQSGQAGADAGQRSALRREAESELRTALANDAEVVPSIAARTSLARMLSDSGRTDEAVAEVEAVFASLRALAADPQRPRRLPAEFRGFEQFERLLQRIDRRDLLVEFAELHMRLQQGDLPPRRR
jgi:hypothetical protein